MIGYESNTIRAALQIFPREKGQKFPRFELQYKPFPKESKQPPLTSHGSIFVVERYLYFIGAETAFTKPLIIVGKFLNPQSAIDFNGLVIRHHDGGGEVFASRAYFERNVDVSGIGELKDELGVMDEKDLPEGIREKSERFLNETDYGGKGALLIQGLSATAP